MTNRDVYASVTDRIIKQLEQGTVPWRKPFSTGGVPISLRSGKPYRGINVLLLALEGYGDPRWGTFKAIKEAGGSVRKGEHGTHIILWKPVPKKREENGEMVDDSYLLLRGYTVFNAMQADGLPPLPEAEEREFTPIEAAQQIVDGYINDPGPPVYYGANGAWYNLTKDIVELPNPENFYADEAFYSTIFHELIHSTGHESRLKRIEPALFGTDPYAREELVAEIGASFLCGVAELDDAGGEQSAAYIAGWLEALQNDRKLVVTAAAQAQKAADFILGTKFEEHAEQRQVVAV